MTGQCHITPLAVGKAFACPAPPTVTALRSSARGWLAFLIAALPILAGSLLPPAGYSADSPPASEYEVKAAFLLNFTRFVDWPDSALADPGMPFFLCVLGDDPFGPVLDRIVEGETVNGRRIEIRRSARQVPSPCNLLFTNAGGKDVSKVLAALGPGVLTVGEGDRFLQEGGMIAFVLDNRRVRFDINQPAAARAELRISSRLLSVARTVAK